MALHPVTAFLVMVYSVNTAVALVPLLTRAIMFETSGEAGWIIREFANATPYPNTGSDAVAFYRRSGSDSDLSVFLDAGRAGLNVAFIQGLTHFHTPLDNPEELDEGSLQHMGSYALALARHFGNVSLDHTKAPDEIYFNIFRFLVHYPEGWAIPFMTIVVLLFVGVVALGFRRRQMSAGGVVLGFLALLGSMIVAALGAYLIWTPIRALHPAEYGPWSMRLLFSGWASPACPSPSPPHSTSGSARRFGSPTWSWVPCSGGCC